MEGCGRQLFLLKALLNSFATSIGLKVNFSKSMMIPINLSAEKLQHLSATFGCSTGTPPFTYLGLPLGLTKPRVEDFLPLVTRCERRLVNTSLFLSQARKLQITNFVFTSLPTFFMSTFLAWALGFGSRNLLLAAKRALQKPNCCLALDSENEDKR